MVKEWVDRVNMYGAPYVLVYIYHGYPMAVQLDGFIMLWVYPATL